MVVSRWYGGTNLGIDNSSILVKRRYWETGAIGGRSCISCSYIKYKLQLHIVNSFTVDPCFTEFTFKFNVAITQVRYGSSTLTT